MKRGKRCRCCGALDLSTCIRFDPKMLGGWSGAPLCEWCVKVIIYENNSTVQERIEKANKP